MHFTITSKNFWIVSKNDQIRAMYWEIFFKEIETPLRLTYWGTPEASCLACKLSKELPTTWAIENLKFQLHISENVCF